MFAFTTGFLGDLFWSRCPIFVLVVHVLDLCSNGLATQIGAWIAEGVIVAISKLERVPVDTSGMRVWAVAQRPAVRQDRRAGGGVEVPKVRDGVQGVEVDVLVAFPDSDEKSAAKFTVYSPVPALPDFAEIRVVGKMFAAVWTAADRAGGGMWFEVGGVAPVAGGSAKGSSDRGAA